MAKNQESINRSLFELLRSRGYAPTLLDTSGKEIPVPEEAEVFQFKFTKDGEEYGTVTASIDGLHKLIIYFGDDVANSEKEDNGGDDSWYKLLNHLKRFSQQHQLSFEVKNRDHLKYDMAKREHMKKQERIAEGYYPMGKKASYNDNIPTVKIVIEHSRQIEEGEQRYRNVNRIFLENTQGERILAPTTKPGVAQIYARHLAEGGMPHDDRWNHIIGLCEEYNKMGAFVRATRNNQFNESAQQLVNEGINHYQSLRESLSKMRGARGYNAYFESYTPPLMEDESEENNLNELFVQETLDPRIESVMPILNKLHKKVAEMKEVNELSEWADSLTEIALEEGEIYSSPTNEAVIPDPKYDHEPPAQESDPIPDDSDHDPIPDDQEPELDEGMMDTIKKVGGKIFDKLGGGSEKDLIKNLQKSAGVEVTGKKPEFDVKAKELARSNPNNPAGNFMKGGKDLGIFKEDLDEARVFGYDIKRVPDLKVSYDDAQELKNQLGMLQKVMMYATPDDMSPEIRSQVKNIYFKITNILQSNGLQESDLMSTDEGMFDKVKDAVKTVGSKVFDKLGGGSEEDLLRDLKDKAGVRNPKNGKPSMAYSDVEKRTDEVDMGQADSSLRNDLKQNNDKMDHFTALGKASKKMGHNHFMDIPDDKLEALRAMVKKFRSGEEVDESALQAYLGDKKYGKDGMKKLRQAGQEDASEKTMQNIRAEYSDKEKPVTEVAGQLSIQQLATISDEALDNAYKYGRSSPGNTFGWQANLKSAQYAKQMIDKGVTDIEAISDAIHKGWNVTAQAFVQNPEQFDDTAKLQTAGKLEAKLQQRAELMKKNYSQLPEEEKEKDRVVARALLQALKGEQGQQGVAEGNGDTEIRPGMQVSQGTVDNVDGNKVTVKTSNGDMMTMNIHDVDQAVTEGQEDLDVIKRLIRK